MSLCTIRQFRISSALDDGRALPPSLQRHTDACPRCRRFLQQSQAIGGRLANEPGAPPLWLHMKIMAGVNAVGRDEKSGASPAWLPVAIGATAIAMIVGAIALSIRSNDDSVIRSAAVPISSPTTPVHPASVPAHFERHAKLALSAEFQNLATDISGAKKFLSASLRSTIPGLGDD